MTFNHAFQLKMLLNTYVRLATFGILLLISVTVTAAGLDIEKGRVDLLKSEALSRPFTIFDQLLYSLQKEATEAAKYLRPKNNEFRFSKLHYSSAEVGHEEIISRIGIVFPVIVSGMNDPWREVCKRNADHMAQTLGVVWLGSQVTHPNPELQSVSVRMFFTKHLGANIPRRNIPVESLRSFLDALVIIVDFRVERAGGKGLAYIRQCALDVRNNQMKYYEHKY